MAKKKENSEEPVLEGEQVTPVDDTVSSESAQANESVEVLTTSAPSRLSLDTEEEALAHVKENYIIPEEINLVLVTSDFNVFLGEHNVGNAVNHMQRNNLKLFRFTWH